MNLRAAVVTAVYSKTMVISTDALSKRTTGEITNLMSVDAGRLQELTPYLHAVWYSMFQIVLAMYFLWQEMGVSCLSGIAVIVCMIPLSNRVSFYMKSLQKTISKTRDERVKITNEVLSGMKVLKLQAWEQQFQHRILRVRDKELAILKQYATAQCLATGLYTAVPLLVALTTFATYLWLGHTLDIATALTSLALFELLRFPLFMLPQVVNNVVEALVSVERISSYLIADEQTQVPPVPAHILRSRFEGYGVSVRDSTFIYETALSRAQLPKHLQLLGGNDELDRSGVFIDNTDEEIVEGRGGAGAGDIELTSQAHRDRKHAHKAFHIQSFIRRPPRRSGEMEGARPRSNAQLWSRYLQKRLYRFVFYLHSLLCRQQSTNGDGGELLSPRMRTKEIEEARKRREEQLKRPLSAAEKALLVQTALLQDAEERLRRLEEQLQLLEGSQHPFLSDIRDVPTGEFLLDPETEHETATGQTGTDAAGKDAEEGSVLISFDDKHDKEVEGDGSAGNTASKRRLLPLRHVTLTAKAGELVAIVGAVGSGKSSLLLALLGQLQLLHTSSVAGPPSSSTSHANTSGVVVHSALHPDSPALTLPRGVCVSGNLGYCAQIPFIRNATLRDNVLFHRVYREDCYRRTLWMCCLEADLAVLPAGDMTEIGERGINLSGGQKARVSLARAVYGVLLHCESIHEPLGVSNPSSSSSSTSFSSSSQAVTAQALSSDPKHRQTQILLLDDVLAAVDASVGRHLFERCILPLARDRRTRTCVLWVTHALQYVRHCDRVVVLHEGVVTQQGSVEALLRDTDTIGAAAAATAAATAASEASTLHRSMPKKRNVFAEMMLAMQATGASASLQQLHKSEVDDAETPLMDAVDAAAADTGVSPNTPPPPYLSESDKHMNSSSSADAAGKEGDDTTKKGDGNGGQQAAGKLVAAETGATGDVSRLTYITWAKAAGGVSVLLFILVFFVAGELLTIFSSYWLSLWSQHNTETEDSGGRASLSTGYFYLGIYGLINLCVIVASIWREFYLRLRGLSAAKQVFEEVLTHVLYAPMSFFDTTPLGRVTNRLSKDVYTVDEQIPGTIRGYLVTTMRVTITLLYVSSITPFFLLLLLPLATFYYLAQRFYIKTSRELTRLESSSRSPIYALFSETLDGLVTLRAYRDERASVTRNEKFLDENVTAYFCNFSANCWLAVRLEFVGTLIVMGAALFAVIARDSYISVVDPNNNSPEHSRGDLALFAGLAGLSISLAMSITQSLNWTVRMASDLESQMVAVERLQEYAQMPQERAHYRVNDPVSSGANSLASSASSSNLVSNPLQQPPAGGKAWPHAGKISFFNVSLKYRPHLPLVLQNVSFTIAPGEKIGVVGRTGAGKSSLLVALLRLVDPLESGHIYLDDLDIGQLGLHVLRANIAVIPQDPVLFSGTVRDNLDPFRKHSDVELNLALQRCHLTHHHDDHDRDRDRDDCNHDSQRASNSYSSKDSRHSSSGTSTRSASQSQDQDSRFRSVTTNTNNIYNINTNNSNDKKKATTTKSHVSSVSLEDTVSENGANFSVGQRQLLCIARALVCRSRVIVMDEATAAVDVETDAALQQTIRRECASATVITIAHRLNTILDSDKVLVLEQGHVAEFDAPHALLSKGADASLFAMLVQHWEETEHKQ